MLIVRVEGEVHPFTRIPLVSPSAYGKQMFVYHPQVASYLRRGLAEDVIVTARSRSRPSPRPRSTPR